MNHDPLSRWCTSEELTSRADLIFFFFFFERKKQEEPFEVHMIDCDPRDKGGTR